MVITRGECIEALEGRRLLAGVTVITHGYQLDGEFPAWVSGMADLVADRAGTPGVDVTEFRLTVTASGATLQKTAGPDLADSPTAEAVVELDWSSISTSETQNGESTIRYVAREAAALLLRANPAQGLAQPLAQLPIHVMGHSRGAVISTELAGALGARGVWVDQVTGLDPHPLTTDDFGVDTPDPQTIVYDNVRYAESYWRADGFNFSDPFDVDGQAITGAHSLRLTESVLDRPGYDLEHSDVHLWYAGTVDPSLTSNADGASPGANWYDGTMGPRTGTGFAFSRLAGGAGSRPAAGLATAGAPRQPPPGPRPPAVTAWDNVEIDGSAADRTVVHGQPVAVRANFEDRNRGGLLTFGLDRDANPYNGFVPISSRALRTRALRTPGVAETSLRTTRVPPGVYHVWARIRGGPTSSRYYYAPGTVTVLKSQPKAQVPAARGEAPATRTSDNAGEVTGGTAQPPEFGTRGGRSHRESVLA